MKKILGLVMILSFMLSANFYVQPVSADYTTTGPVQPVLKQRNESGITILGDEAWGADFDNDSWYVPGRSGYVAGDWTLMGRDHHVVLEGEGYIRVRWELEWWYGWGQIAWPEITALTDDTEVILVSEGHRFDFKTDYNMSEDYPELGHGDWYIWFKGKIRIQNVERQPKTPFTASYNLGISVSGINYHSVQANSVVIYDTEDGHFPQNTYKIVTRGTGANEHWAGNVLEVRDRGFESSDKYEGGTNNGAGREKVVYKNADVDSYNQWWEITPLGDGYYTIVNNMSGKALSVSSDLAGYTVITEDIDSSSDKQKWKITKATAKQPWEIDSKQLSTAIYYNIENKFSGMYLTDVGGSIMQTPLNGNVGTQLFYLRYTRGYPNSLNSAFAPNDGYARYEAESLETSEYNSDAIIAGNSSISGTRYVHLNNENSYISYKVNVPESGLYDINIHYGSDVDVTQDIHVNGEKQPEQVSYTQTSLYIGGNGADRGPSRLLRLLSGVGDVKAIQLWLNEGENIITFANTSNDVLDMDYIEVSNAVAANTTNTVTDATYGETSLAN